MLFFHMRRHLGFNDSYSQLASIKCLQTQERDSQQQDCPHGNAQHPAELPTIAICFVFVLRYLICENLSNLYTVFMVLHD